MTIDPRLIDRRREVAEDRARRNVTRLLKFLIVITVAGAVVWLFLSPYLSVDRVDVLGVDRSGVAEILDEHGVVPGTPMILIRAGVVRRVLEDDPWVAHANVDLVWPGSVLVDVDERVPAAWVRTADGWSRRAIDGFAVPSAERPDQSLAHVELPEVGEASAPTSEELLGAVEFASMLPVSLQTKTVIRMGDNGEMWAEVDGYQVRLGRPVEMTAKALSLVAMLGEQPPRDSIITLVAPTHPALTPKGAWDEQSTGAGKDKGSD